MDIERQKTFHLHEERRWFSNKEEIEAFEGTTDRNLKQELSYRKQIARQLHKH